MNSFKHIFRVKRSLKSILEAQDLMTDRIKVLPLICNFCASNIFSRKMREVLF